MNVRLSQVRDEAPRESLRDRVARSILDVIVVERLGPGAPLPSEMKLAEQFGVSRVVVREACRTLSAQGIVDIRHGKGMFVSTWSSSTLSTQIAFALRQDAHLFEDLLEVRFSIEVQAAELAAQRAERHHIEQLRTALDATRRVLLDFDRLARADVDFHNAILDASQNEILRFVGTAFQELLIESRRLTYAGSFFRGETSRVALEDHERILQCIEATDSAGAAEAMRDHLSMTEGALVAANHRLRDFGHTPLDTPGMLALALAERERSS